MLFELTKTIIRGLLIFIIYISTCMYMHNTIIKTVSYERRK